MAPEHNIVIAIIKTKITNGYLATNTRFSKIYK